MKNYSLTLFRVCKLKPREVSLYKSLSANENLVKATPISEAVERVAYNAQRKMGDFAAPGASASGAATVGVQPSVSGLGHAITQPVTAGGMKKPSLGGQVDLTNTQKRVNEALSGFGKEVVGGLAQSGSAIKRDIEQKVVNPVADTVRAYADVPWKIAQTAERAIRGVPQVVKDVASGNAVKKFEEFGREADKATVEMGHKILTDPNYRKQLFKETQAQVMGMAGRGLRTKGPTVAQVAEGIGAAPPAEPIKPAAGRPPGASTLGTAEPQTLKIIQDVTKRSRAAESTPEPVSVPKEPTAVNVDVPPIPHEVAARIHLPRNLRGGMEGTRETEKLLEASRGGYGPLREHIAKIVGRKEQANIAAKILPRNERAAVVSSPWEPKIQSTRGPGPEVFDKELPGGPGQPARSGKVPFYTAKDIEAAKESLGDLDAKAPLLRKQRDKLWPVPKEPVSKRVFDRIKTGVTEAGAKAKEMGVKAKEATTTAATSLVDQVKLANQKIVENIRGRRALKESEKFHAEAMEEQAARQEAANKEGAYQHWLANRKEIEADLKSRAEYDQYLKNTTKVEKEIIPPSAGEKTKIPFEEKHPLIAEAGKKAVELAGRGVAAPFTRRVATNFLKKTEKVRSVPLREGGWERTKTTTHEPVYKREFSKYRTAGTGILAAGATAYVAGPERVGRFFGRTAYDVKNVPKEGKGVVSRVVNSANQAYRDEETKDKILESGRAAAEYATGELEKQKGQQKVAAQERVKRFIGSPSGLPGKAKEVTNLVSGEALAERTNKQVTNLINRAKEKAAREKATREEKAKTPKSDKKPKGIAPY